MRCVDGRWGSTFHCVDGDMRRTWSEMAYSVFSITDPFRIDHRSYANNRVASNDGTTYQDVLDDLYDRMAAAATLVPEMYMPGEPSAPHTAAA